MPRWLRYFLLCVLIAIAFALPSIQPSGRSILVWIQQKALRANAPSDAWREAHKPAKAEKANANANAKAAGGSAGNLPVSGEAAKKGCRAEGEALTTIPHPEHYQLLAECVTVLGTVRSEPHRDPDGLLFNFDVDPSYLHLFVAEKTEVEKGQTHQKLKPAIGTAIIVPADLPGCEPGQQIKQKRSGTTTFVPCSGLGVVVPPPGTKIEITGAFVFDRESKIHVICPVWSITPRVN
jgi:hypothetical protein